MKDNNIGNKILQEQTGHKTLLMLEHYANHQTQIDIDKLENAQKEVFGSVINSAKL